MFISKKKVGFTLIEMVVGIVVIGIVMIPVALACLRFTAAATRVGALAVARDYLSNNIEMDNHWAWGVDNSPIDDASSYFEDIDYPQAKVPPLYHSRHADWPYFRIDNAYFVGVEYPARDSHTPPTFLGAKYTMYAGPSTSSPKVLEMEGNTLGYMIPDWIFRARSWEYQGYLPVQSQLFTLTRNSAPYPDSYMCAAPDPGVLKTYLTVFFERREHFKVYQLTWNLDTTCRHPNQPPSPQPEGYVQVSIMNHRWHIPFKYFATPRIIGVEMSITSGQPRSVEAIGFGEGSFPTLITGTAVPDVGSNFWNFDPGLPPPVLGAVPALFQKTDRSAYTIPHPVDPIEHPELYSDQGLPPYDGAIGPPWDFPPPTFANNIWGRDIGMQIRFSPITGAPPSTTVSSVVETHIIFSDGSELGGRWVIDVNVDAAGAEAPGTGGSLDSAHWKDLVTDNTSDSYWYDYLPYTTPDANYNPDRHEIVPLR